MTAEGLPVALLTGDLTIEQRAHTITRFREGVDKALITTNVSSRGAFICFLLFRLIVFQPVLYSVSLWHA